MSQKDTLSRYWPSFQRGLFPWLGEELGPPSERHKRLVQVLEVVCVEELLAGTRDGSPAGGPGRFGAGLSGEVGIRYAHDAGAGRGAVRLGECWGGAPQGDPLAGLRGIRDERVWEGARRSGGPKR